MTAAQHEGSSLHPVQGGAAALLERLRAWDVEADPPPLVVETSGSTGEPKRVLLSRRAMRASADATHARLGGPGRWVLNLPPTYVAGLQVLFRSVRADREPVVTSDLLVAADRTREERSFVSLVPTQLHRALADPEQLRALGTFAAVLVGGGPLAPADRRTAEEAGVRVVQTYGMTETCGGCVYDGVALDGVALRIDADGQVLVAGQVLFDGYQGDPQRTAAVLHDGWFRTQDLGTLDHDGRLQVLGRVDDIVISGGVKVPTPAVEQALRAHPGIRDVAVVGRPDPEWGEEVVAVVVADQPVDLATVRSWVPDRTWAPRALLRVPALPALPNGKPDRRTLRRWASQGVSR